MLHTKENTVSYQPRSAAQRRRVSTAQASIKAVAAAPASSAGRNRRERIWSDPLDQNKFRFASESAAAPLKRDLPVRKPTAAPNSRLARSEARLITAAIAATTTICGVLVLYLCSYANIASLGIHEADARMQLRQAQADNETLSLQYAALRSPERISAAAKALNMQNIPGPETFINPRAAAASEATNGVGSGVTINNNTQNKVADRGTFGEKSEPTGAI